jgi:transcriptional antiterminator RfaH
MDRWYTLHTKPNAEYQVATALQQRGIQTYLPEIESLHAQERRKRKPFFPCYLFARFNLKVVGISSVKWTPGLHRIVAFDEQPVPLADEVIELIRRKVRELDSTVVYQIICLSRVIRYGSSMARLRIC